MTPFELDRLSRTLDSLNQFPEACRRRGVVVAEADPETCREVARWLIEHEQDVWTAGSAVAAVRVCSDHAGDVDVLVTGDELDGMLAPDLFGRLRTCIPWLQCCILTRYPERAAVAEAARMGATVVAFRGHTDTLLEPLPERASRGEPMVRKLIDWAVANPLVVLILTAALAIGGGYAFTHVNIEAYPDPAPAIIEVVAQYPGASAEEVERQVTIPLEVALAGMPGLETTRSKSLFGLSHLRNQFDYDRDYDQAKQDVLNRLAMVNLPPGVTPQISPASPIGEILRFTLENPRDPSHRQAALHAQRSEDGAGLRDPAGTAARAADRRRHRDRRDGEAVRGPARPGPAAAVRDHAGPAPERARATRTPTAAATT